MRRYNPFESRRGQDWKSGGVSAADPDYQEDWEQASWEQIADARNRLGRAERGNTAAQQQLRQGSAQAQRQLYTRAHGGGAGAARAAMYGAGDIETRARVQSDLLRAQEAAQARMQLGATLQQRGDALFGQDQYRMQDHFGDEQRYLEDAQRAAMGEENERQRILQATGSTLSAVGMGMSDRRRKWVY